MRAFGRVAAWVQARPAWARPALVGAGLLAAVTALRAVFVLLARPREPRVVLLALGAIVLAAAAGAGGGLVYALVGRPLRRVPVAGPYLAGVVAVWGYMLGVGGMLWLAPGHAGLRVDGPGNVALFAGYAALLGLVFGHQAFREPRA